MLSSGFVVLCMFIVIINENMGFPCTILEQFGHVSLILGASNLGAKIKDLHMCVWRKNINSL